MSTPLEAWQNLICALKEKHHEIKKAEQTALDFLAQGDQASYKKFMEEKAKLIANLHDSLLNLLEKLPVNLKAQIEPLLQHFSKSAALGLKLGSLFYWSSLLYRDDHKVGEPDNLEVLIAKMQTEGLAFTK
ncbi:MAG: hypothetical protein IJU40_05855 [Desulfovibrionaceae bacterium]|nr:hypothetical protein [Desulfovibrionaceae bacterium]